jgi:AbrB family looped-hinge helix DNA binding protein
MSQRVASSNLRAVGIVRRIDELGRIVLPKELRDAMDIPVGTRLEFLSATDRDGQAVVLRKFDPETFGKTEDENDAGPQRRDSGPY